MGLGYHPCDKPDGFAKDFICPKDGGRESYFFL